MGVLRVHVTCATCVHECVPVWASKVSIWSSKCVFALEDLGPWRDVASVTRITTRIWVFGRVPFFWGRNRKFVEEPCVTCYELSRLAEVGYWVEGTFISDLVSVDRVATCL